MASVKTYKRIPWKIFSIPFLLLFVSQTHQETNNNNDFANQETITDGNAFNPAVGKEYFENIYGRSLNDLDLYIQRSCFIPVIVDGSIQYCYCFDFENDKGYAIFDDEKIYRLIIEGDFPWIFETNVYYDLEGGFLLYKEDADSFQKIDDDTGKLLVDEYSPALSMGVYDNVDGCIDSAALNNYVSSVHPNWLLTNTVTMSNYYKRSMWANSFYTCRYTYSDGSVSNRYTEGNCGPNSMFSYLYNLPTAISPTGAKYSYCERLLNGRSVTSRYDYFKSGFDAFSDLLTDNVYIVDDKGTSSVKKAFSHWEMKDATDRVWTKSDDLYWLVRTESVKKGFDPRSGFNMNSYSEYVLEKILSMYSYSVDIYKTSVSLNVARIVGFGIPVVVAANNSITYGNHGMTIYGYKRYEYQETVNGAPTTKSSYIWLVDDGWDSDYGPKPRWFDPNRGSINNYFCTNRNSLTWSAC